MGFRSMEIEVLKTKQYHKNSQTGRRQRQEADLFKWLAGWLPQQDNQTQQIIYKHIGSDRLMRFRTWNNELKREGVA
jgi:hypothetical protein